MNAATESKVVKLSDDDQARMVRLREEVIARLEEMNLILSRNLGRDFHDENGFLGFHLYMPPLSEGKGEPAVPHLGPYDRCIETIGKNGCYDHCRKLCYVCKHYPYDK